MPEEQGSGQGTPGAGAGEQQQQQQGGTGDGNGNSQGLFDGPFDEARARTLIDKLRPYEQQSKDLQRQLEEANAKVTEFENAGRTELEKAQTKVADLERQVTSLNTQLQETRLRGSFESAAARAGALYPDSVWKLADLSRVEFETDGTPKNLDAVLEAMKKAYPALFGQPVRGNGSADGGVQGSGAQGGTGINDWIRGAAGRH